MVYEAPTMNCNVTVLPAGAMSFYISLPSSLYCTLSDKSETYSPPKKLNAKDIEYMGTKKIPSIKHWSVLM